MGNLRIFFCDSILIFIEKIRNLLLVVLIQIRVIIPKSPNELITLTNFFSDTYHLSPTAKYSSIP